MEEKDAKQPPPDGDGAETGDSVEEESFSPWGEYRTLLWATLASAALHLAILGGAHYLDHFQIDLNGDVEWLATSDDLTGVGQGRQDRFAELDEVVDQPEKPPTPEPNEAADAITDEESLQKALKGEFEPPEPEPPEPKEPEPADQPPEPPKETTPPDPAKLPAEQTAPEPEKEPDEAPAVAAKDEPDDESTDKPTPVADGDGPTEEISAADRAFGAISEHAALDRAGPNNLPDMRSFAPGNARVTALIRVNTIRGQPYEDVVRKVLRAVPDYRLLLGIPEFDPIRDMDAFFMASPDPRYVQNTFLAVHHNLSTPRVRELLDRRYPNPPDWRTFEEYPVRPLVPENRHYRDPRRIVLAGDGLALLAKEKLLEQIVAPLAANSSLLSPSKATAQPAERPDDEETAGSRATDTERPSLIDGLARIQQVARRDDAIVILNFEGLVLTLPGIGRLRGMRGLRMAVTQPKQPTLDIDMRFQNPQQARRFARRCPQMRQAIKDAIPFSGALGLSELLDKLACNPDDAFVNVSGQFTPEQVKRLGNLAHPFLPRPPALDELPNPPEPKPQAAPDAGPGSAPDAGASPDTGE